MRTLPKVKLSLAIFAATVFTLSAAHHRFNFWGREVSVEAAILLAVFPAAALIFFALNRAWDFILRVEQRRWLLFLLPALLVSAGLTWRFYKAPSVWHTVQIIPKPDQSGEVILYEIKSPAGSRIKFDKQAAAAEWQVVSSDMVKTVGETPAPLEYSFFAPIGGNAQLLFAASPQSRDVIIVLDGQKREANLRREEESQVSIEIPVAYKMGFPGGVVFALVAAIDFAAYFLLLLALWLVQEISQLFPQNEQTEDRFLSHRAGLGILLALGLLLHALNALAVPLIIGPDSPSFLEGAFHWVKYRNFEGVPPARGPGMAALFIPSLLLFGRSAWGVKLTLHLLALACVPLGYKIGYDLFRRRAHAFFAGLAFVLMPEMYLYSNIVMSDGPNTLTALIFCALWLPALKTLSPKYVLASLLAASLATLLRPENQLLILVAFFFLALKIVYEKTNWKSRAAVLALGALLAALPLLGWSARNQKLHGFFGLSDYSGVIWYDGWIYYGEASKFPVTDKDSPAVKAIEEAVAAYDQPIEYAVVPTSLELYPALLQYGYTPNESMRLFTQAAMDSIKKDPRLSLELYWFKIRKSFEPEFNSVMATNFKPNATFENEYFDVERPLFPPAVEWQKRAYQALVWTNARLYRPLILLALVVMFFAVYQKEFFKWAALAGLTFTRLFVGITIGLGAWRYMISGVALLFFFALLSVEILRNFFETLQPKA